jgi:hypothetical protein
MKQDYLWDKTGEDPEIEKLENALAAFRCQENAPPALPAKVLHFPLRIAKKTPRRRFSLTFAFAACAAAVLITLSILFQFSNSETTGANDLAQTTAPQISSGVLPIEKAKTPQQAEIPKRDEKPFEKKIAKQNVVKFPHLPSGELRQHKTIAQHTEISKPNQTALTAEEKHAYEQLMLALSITGSKLKIVKDKIDGVEEQNTVIKDGR